MASTTRFLLVLTMVLCIFKCVSCIEFQVGERAGWIVPPANNSKIYNEWASQKRFRVGDTICFKYKKDSVMEVNKTNYDECNSDRPNYFSNTGNTIYTLDRSGFFYFISGATGHCEKGQRMIIWVIEQEGNSAAAGSGGTSDASINSAMVSYGVVFIMVAFQFVYQQYV
ncbi:hypothetical protein ACJIZ3_015114 [Penstemon smallii]|uniref:Phytocyanin domain-containing protein n=1 Tax=Penstemon smallii TaxID=265156 RepID=A0ABD3RPL4_9LAMI